MLSTFCTWTGSLKRTPKWTFYAIYLWCQFFLWSFNFLIIRLLSAEIRMSKLSKVWYQNKQPLLKCFTLDKFFSSVGQSAKTYWNLFSRNYPTLCFWLRREGLQMPNAKQFIKLKKTAEIFHNNSVIINFAIFKGKHLWKYLSTPILKNICVWLIVNWL